jgi:hypothetical protein
MLLKKLVKFYLYKRGYLFHVYLPLLVDVKKKGGFNATPEVYVHKYTRSGCEYGFCNIKSV